MLCPNFLCLSMRKINVLYISHTTTLGGAALSLYNLIHSVRYSIDPVVLIPGDGPAADFFRDREVKCIIHPFKCNIRSNRKILHYLFFMPRLLRDTIVNFCCCRYIHRELKDKKIDIVHSNASVFTIGVTISKMLLAKHIWHIREFQDIDFGIQPFLGWKDLKRKIYASDAVIAITKAVYDHWGLNKARKSYCIWDAVRSRSEVIFKKKKQKYFFFCAAQLSDNKGAAFAIEAFIKSGLANCGYRLIMAGSLSDEYKSVLLLDLEKHNLVSAVDFIGYLSNIEPYMSEACAFLMCSRNEGLGRVTVEAMFYGCPVIAMATGGTLEFIADGKTGLLFNDISSCAMAMCKVVSESSLDMIHNAQIYALENFSEEEYGKSILRIYNDMLN